MAFLSAVVYVVMFLALVVRGYIHLRSRERSLSQLSAQARESAKVGRGERRRRKGRSKGRRELKGRALFPPPLLSLSLSLRVSSLAGSVSFSSQ